MALISTTIQVKRYLNGLTYNLESGGVLAPDPAVPEPATIIIWSLLVREAGWGCGVAAVPRTGWPASLVARGPDSHHILDRILVERGRN